MIDAVSQVTHVKVVRQVVRIKQGNQQRIIDRVDKPRLSVVRAGVQGPTGTVAEEVLNLAESAERAANAAHAIATTNSADLDKLITDMNSAFEYHAGAMSAIGE